MPRSHIDKEMGETLTEAAKTADEHIRGCGVEDARGGGSVKDGDDGGLVPRERDFPKVFARLHEAEGVFDRANGIRGHRCNGPGDTLPEEVKGALHDLFHERRVAGHDVFEIEEAKSRVVHERPHLETGVVENVSHPDFDKGAKGRDASPRLL